MSVVLRSLLVVGLVLAGLVGRGAGAAVSWKVVTELDRFEPFNAMAFHDGRLWVGSSRVNLGASYKLDVFDSAGTLLETKEMSHSLRYLSPFGPHGILTVGVSYKDQLTHYTVVSGETKLKVEPKTIPVQAYADEGAGRPGVLYFTDPGGLDDGILGKPARTIFTLGWLGPRYLKARIAGPHNPLLVGDSLFLIEHPTIASGGRYLVRVDLKTETSTRLLEGSDLASLILLADGKTLAVADRDAGDVRLVEAATGTTLKTYSVAAQRPRALAQLGHCLAVASEESKHVTFFDLRNNKVQGEWDLSVVGKKLYGLRSLAADSTTGRVYVRSAYPDFVGNASPDTDRNSVVLAEETDGATFQACR